MVVGAFKGAAAGKVDEEELVYAVARAKFQLVVGIEVCKENSSDGPTVTV